MAFFSKFGNILKQTASKHLNGQTQISVSSPSFFQAIRCMSSSKLFVGGISYSTDEQSLREAFSKYGEVVESRVIVDRETGRSRGFGFITYTSTEEASSAIQALDGQDLHGRRVRVNYATDRSGGFRSPGFGGNYGPPGGGYGAGAGAGGHWGGAGGYGGGTGGYGDGADGYGGGASGYGAGAGGYSGGASAGDSYIQGGTGGGNFGGDQFGGYNQFGGGDLGGNNQFGGGNFGGNNQFGGSPGQFGGDNQVGGGDFGGNNQFDVSDSGGSGQFGNEFGGGNQFGGDDQLGSMENNNINGEDGDWKDDEDDLAKRA